ncbi:MAG: aminopeptidase [Ignavibacteria bacterium]|nr:aminopeptidase [Ignavibacteria bacterium]
MASTPRTLDDIASIPFPPAYASGARNAIGTCLRLAPGERFTLITDEATLPIAASIVQDVRACGNPMNVFVLEDYGMRPMTALPAPILAALEQCDVSIYACRTQTGELSHRIEMMGVINRVKPRHGHMVNINHQIMMEGMQADFNEVDRLSRRVYDLASVARRITAKTKRGTDLEVALSPDLRWLKTSGIITRDKWGNLPGGEIFTSPARVDGVFVVDGVVGDYLCEKYGDLEAAPLTIDIENSRIRSCTSDNKELEEEFVRYCMTDENSNRVGEFAIGTNIALTRVIGHILQDEKIPGVHIAFGHPYSEHTGADWRSTTHIDVVGRDFDIWIEGRRIMTDGRFTL